MPKNYNQNKKYEAHTLSNQLDRYIEQIRNRLLDIQQHLTFYNQTLNTVQIAKKWIQLQGEERTQAIQSGSNLYTPSYSTKSRFVDLDYTLRQTNLISKKWNYKIANTFINKSLQKTDDFLILLGLMAMILDGVFFQTDEDIMTTQIKPNFVTGPCQAYFRTQYLSRLNLIFEVAIDRTPILNTQKTLIGFNYIHTITFLEVRYDAKIENQLSNIIVKYNILMSKEIYRQDYQQLQSKSVNRVNGRSNYKKESYLFNLKYNLQGEIYGEFLYNCNQDFISYWMPNQFSPFYLTKEEQSFMVFEQSLYRWVPSDYTKVQEAKRFREYQASINKELLKRYADFSSAAKLVQLLQKIPNFKIKLTEQEQEVVGANGNVMVIGRSGTGKTTCAILRLFSMEMLFRLRLNLYKQKHQNVLLNTKIQEGDLDNQVGLHCVFVTASPILTSEVKRYYTKLTEQIKQELEKKRLKDQEKRRQELINQKLEQSQFQVVDKDDKQIEEKYFEDKLGEIEIKQQQEGFDSEEEIDQLEDEEDKVNAELNKFNSFEEMKDKDFPAFFTIRKLLLLIDGSLQVPFFQRNKNKKVIGSNDQANWHNDKQGVMLINKYKEREDENENYESDEDICQEEEEEIDLTKLTEKELEQEYQRQMFLMKRQNSSKQEKTESILAQEVDYEYFVNHFWPCCCNDVPKKMGITPNFVWTQIYSHIKGSASAHKYSGWYLPEKIFEKQIKGQMEPEVAKLAFDFFIKYERWKVKYNFYDLMDVVNYMIIQFKAGRYEIMPIHYLMIDEVQDLPHAILCLLCAVTEQGLFFSGDTAQNIAKGVGFRFQDLKSLFNQPDHYDVFKFDNVNVHQLSVNFRSHNNILQLANSLVSIIEFFFPKTIDKLQKERSDIQGPKPILVTDCNPESLFQLLGSDINQNKQQVGERLPIEFGCNQVILVKNQEAKAKIPTILQHALVLTIYEAKGLEFDDVILYNFFTDEWIGDQQWNILHNLNIVRELVKKEDFESQITKHKKEEEQDKELENNSFSEKLYGYTEIDGKIELLKLVNNKHLDFNVTFFSSLCNELKSLYVAITRPRQRLIIYDDQPLHRKQIQQIWEQLGLVNLYNIETILENQEKVQLKTSPQEWRKTGLKMFRNKFYEQAIKCFKLAGEHVLTQKSTAFYLAQNGQNLTNQITAIQNKKGLATKEDKTKVKELKKEMNQAYVEASKLFLEVGNRIKAAQCLFSAESYEEAYEIYIAEGMKREAAEAAFAQGNYKQAGDFFSEVGDFLRCIESYEKYHDYESIIIALNKEKDLPVDTKTGYLRKYLPKILSQLTNQVGHNDNVQQEGEMKEEKEQVIQEEDEDDSEYDDSDEEENQKKQQEKSKQQQLQDAKQVEEPKVEEESHLTLDKINQLQDDTMQLVKQESLDVQSDNSQSFSVQNSQQSQSFQVENSQIISQHDKSESFQVQSENQEDVSKAELYEHLSRYDPDDQWLQCSDKKSIIESIVSKQSEHSDFSAFSYAQIQNNPNMQLVKTKGDIFIQDSVMQQLIRYISMFSEEFKFQLDNQRSKQVQLSNKIQQQEALDYMVDFILDLDLVDMSFIYLVLDILEEFKSFKLCIFVCNRYKLADKLGRYLTSIAATYSPLCINKANLEINYLINGHSRNSQIDKGLVAAHAVHNVFENINPDFLRLKYENEALDNSNSLGQYCYQQMILLGFWKKILYQLNVPNALKICEAYLDFSNWKFIYFTNRIHKIEEQIEKDNDNELKQIYQTQLLISKKKLELSFLSNTNFDILYFDEPKDEADLSLALIAMEQYYLKLFYQLVLNNQCGENLFFRSKTMDPKVLKEDLSKIAFPKYLSLTKEVVQSFIIEHTLNQEIVNSLIDALDQKECTGIGKLKVFEASFWLFLIMELIVHSKNYSSAVEFLINLPNNRFIQLQNALEKIIQTTISVQDSKIPQRNLFKRCLLLRYKCRIPESELFAPFFNSVFVHRSSPLIQDLISMKTQEQFKQDNFKLDDNYFQDIDLEFVVSPHNAIIQLVYQRMRKSFEAFTALRLNSYKKKINDLTQEEQIELMAQSVVAQDKKLRNLNKVHYKKTEAVQKYDLIEQYRQQEQLEQQKKQYQIMMMVQQDIENDDKEKVVIQDEQIEEQPISKNKRNTIQQTLTKKQLINCLTCVSAQHIKLDKLVRQGILKLAIKQLNNALTAQTTEACHIYVKRGILLFDFIDLSHYSIQFIQKNKQFKSYIHFIEFLTCRKHNTINDAAACFLQYYDYKHQIITDYEMNYISNFLILHQQIALLMSKNTKTTFILPYNYLMYFSNVQYIDDTHFSVKMKLQVSSDEDPIVEILNVFLEKLQSNNSAFYRQAIDLLIILLLNNQTIRTNTLKILQEIQSILMISHYKDQGVQLIEKLFSESSLIFRQNMAYNYEQYQLDLTELSITNELTNEEQINQAYQACIEEWEEYKTLNDKLIEPINYLINKYRQYKKSNKFRNGQTFQKILHFHFNEYQLSRQMRQSQWMAIYSEFTQIRKLLLTSFYSMFLDNPIDFHFISIKINILTQYEKDYEKVYKGFESNKISVKEFNEKNISLVKEMEEWREELKQWQWYNVKQFERNMDKLLERNRKLLALKWMNQKAGLQLQQIQKRKKGLKRQQLLEQKKRIMKL